MGDKGGKREDVYDPGKEKTAMQPAAQILQTDYRTKAPNQHRCALDSHQGAVGRTWKTPPLRLGN